jgi:hypothetical protein
VEQEPTLLGAQSGRAKDPRGLVSALEDALKASARSTRPADELEFTLISADIGVEPRRRFRADPATVARH